MLHLHAPPTASLYVGLAGERKGGKLLVRRQSRSLPKCEITELWKAKLTDN